MNISEEKRKEIIACEGFIRRAASLQLPFMLKGSFLGRHYFSNPDDRVPNDLDWVYLHPLNDRDKAIKVFDEWMTAVSETYKNDGVRFRSFKENEFWRAVDYDLDDDFATVCTDLDCWVDGEKLYRCFVDITCNLPVDVAPVPFLYTPLRGEPFIIPYTTPLALQVSWKLHQTLVNPRIKDLFDLMNLVLHKDFTPEVLQLSLRALENECARDKTDLNGRLQCLLNGDWTQLFNHSIVVISMAGNITDRKNLPASTDEFKEQFKTAFMAAGFYNII